MSPSSLGPLKAGARGGPECPKHRGGYRTRFQRRGGGWGIRYPKAPSRNAREGLSSPRARRPHTQRKPPPSCPRSHTFWRATPGAGGEGHGGRATTWTGPAQVLLYTQRALAIGAVERGEGASPRCLGARPLDSPGGLHPQLTKKKRAPRCCVGKAGKRRDRKEKRRKITRRQRKNSHGPASGRPSLTRPNIAIARAAQRATKRLKTRAPSREGDGRAFPFVRSRLTLLFPVPFSHGTTDSGGPSGGLAGNGERHHLLGLRHLKGHPGALQGHQPRAKAKERPHAQQERRVRRGGGTPPPRRGEGRLHKDAAGKASAESVRCVTETTGRDHHRGRAGFRTPSPSTHRHRARGK